MMFTLFAVLLISGAAMARNVPGPGDPDTYPLPYIKYEVSPGVIITEDITGPIIDFTPTKNMVKISYFNKNRPDQGTVISLTNAVSELKNTDFDKSRPTAFIIHGWKNNGESPISVLIRKAILPKNVNVFVVDWSEVAMRNYVTARNAVADIGLFVGQFINDIKTGNGLKLETTRIVGHSLGAHVSGFAGAATDSKVDTIIGLDPAFPLFYFSKKQGRLNDDDARYVQIIHTNGNLLGMPYSIGHGDFYPNGGKSQAGCFLDVTGACAHARAYLYYEESLKSGNFVSSLCGSYKDYKQGLCFHKPRADMGEYDTDKNAKGDFYLDTNNAAPFAKGA